MAWKASPGAVAAPLPRRYRLRISATAAPQLNLNGTLIYSSGINRFTGTLTNAGGTLSGTSTGQFYGPAAEELGGVFKLSAPSGPEMFVGAYGGKR